MKMSANDSNSANECWQYKTLDSNNTYFPLHKRRSTYEKDAHAMVRIDSTLSVEKASFHFEKSRLFIRKRWLSL